MTGTKKPTRSAFFEPLFRTAIEQAKKNSNALECIDERIAYCLKLLSGNSPVPAQPQEIACLLLDFAAKMNRFQDILDNVNPWEIRSWSAVEIFANDLIKEDAEQGIKCIELATLYQIRYWTQSPDRFHGTNREKAHYIKFLASLLAKLHMENINFEQFDNWCFQPQ